MGTLGMGQQNFGMGQQGVGGNLLNLTLQSLLQGRGQDVQELGQNKQLAGQLSGDLTQGLLGATRQTPQASISIWT